MVAFGTVYYIHIIQGDDKIIAQADPKKHQKIRYITYATSLDSFQKTRKLRQQKKYLDSVLYNLRSPSGDFFYVYIANIKVLVFLFLVFLFNFLLLLCRTPPSETPRAMPVKKKVK